MQQLYASTTLRLLTLLTLILCTSCQPDDPLRKAQPQLAVANPGAPLKVMTFNIRQQFPADLQDGTPLWEDRKNLVLQMISDNAPDIVLLQEDQVAVRKLAVIGGTGVTNGDTIVLDTIPQDTLVIKPLEFLRNNLSQYTFYGAGSRDGIPGGEGEHVSILYLSSRFTELATGNVALSDSFHVPGSITWGNNTPRKATWVKLSDQLANPGENFENFVVLNTHFDANSDSAIVARKKSAELLVDLIGSLSNGAPVILGGDFNSKEDNTPYSTLLFGGPIPLLDGYRELIPMRDQDEATFHGFTGNVTGSRIDMIFHTGALETIDAQILRTDYSGAYPSDHYPLMLEIQ